MDGLGALTKFSFFDLLGKNVPEERGFYGAAFPAAGLPKASIH
jgi:hypothetical protein